jgi:hypothetical protein
MITRILKLLGLRKQEEKTARNPLDGTLRALGLTPDAGGMQLGAGYYGTVTCTDMSAELLQLMVEVLNERGIDARIDKRESSIHPGTFSKPGYFRIAVGEMKMIVGIRTGPSSPREGCLGFMPEGRDGNFGIELIITDVPAPSRREYETHEWDATVWCKDILNASCLQDPSCDIDGAVDEIERIHDVLASQL